jgi:hypothetical protein
VIATIPIGQAAQALNYVSNAVPDGRLAGRVCSPSALPVRRLTLRLMPDRAADD